MIAFLRPGDRIEVAGVPGYVFKERIENGFIATNPDGVDEQYFFKDVRPKPEPKTTDSKGQYLLLFDI